MNNTLIGCLIAATVCAGAASAGRSPQKTLDQAVDICTERAIRFGRKPFGLRGDEPPPYRVQTDYRACVWAYAHQYPQSPVEYRDPLPTVLRNVLK